MYVSLARVCHLYYKQNLTQQQIADELGVSRINVSRMLQRARADQIVRITINYSDYYPDLEERLHDRYPHVSFVISDSLDGSTEQVRRSIAATGAEWLGRALRPGVRVAVGWGTTLGEVAGMIEGHLPETEFVPLIGGQVNAGLDVHANSIAERLAARTRGRAQRILAPAVADSEAHRDMFKSSDSVAETLAAAATASTSVFSLGSPFFRESTIGIVGYYSPEVLEILRASGAVLDVISVRYYDSEARTCAEDIARRTVSISDEELRRIQRKVCIAGGASKHQAVRIALLLGYIDVLITDDDTARYLLDNVERVP